MAKMSEQREKEFEELSSFVYFFATYVWNKPESTENHPAQFLRTDKFTKSQLLTGLRQATNDIVEYTLDYNAEQLALINAACRQRNVLSVSEVRRRYWSKYKSVLNKQRIQNETEYYLIVGLLSDCADSVSESDRALLQSLSDGYEQRRAQQGVQADVARKAAPRRLT